MQLYIPESASSKKTARIILFVTKPLNVTSNKEPPLHNHGHQSGEQQQGFQSVSSTVQVGECERNPDTVVRVLQTTQVIKPGQHLQCSRSFKSPRCYHQLHRALSEFPLSFSNMIQIFRSSLVSLQFEPKLCDYAILIQ